MLKVPFKVRRPFGLRNHPLVDFFYYTGEALNPWRCGMHATKRQQKLAAEVSEQEATWFNKGTPGCCRRCGLDYYR